MNHLSQRPRRNGFTLKKQCDPIVPTGNPEIDDLLRRAFENDRLGAKFVAPAHWYAGRREREE